MTRWRLPLRGRLLLLTVVALAPAAGLLGWTEFQLRQARATEIQELALRYAQLASLELASIVDGIESLMLAIAQSPPVATLQAGDCNAYLARVIGDAPQLRALALFDLQGTARCASAASVPTPSAASWAAAAPATPGGRLVIGTYQDDAGHPVVPLVMPLRAANEFRLVGFLDLEWLGARIRERGLDAGNSLTIADAGGTIIAREPLPQQFVGTRIPEMFDGLIHADAPGTLHVTSQDGTSRILGYHPVNTPPSGIYVSAGVSEQEAFRTIDLTRSRNFMIIVVAGLASFALAWIIGQRFIQRPVQRLLACVHAWQRGDLGARTGMQAAMGDLESVGAAFDLLIEELTRRQAARDLVETQRQLLVGELTHRVKNTLALVQAIAAQSLRGTGDVARARENFHSRLLALADAHDILTSNDWEAAELQDVLERTLRPYRDGWSDRFVLAGPSLRLQPRAALAVGLAVHELATNAVKYGALGAERGQVMVTWDVETEPDGRFRLTWTERGGPTIGAPLRRGFGSRLIQSAFGTELHGSAQMEFAAEGLRCRFEAPLRAVAAELASL